MDGDDVSKQAGELAKRGSRKGGLARAQALDGAERSEIASRAAAARWGDTRVATKVGELQIGNLGLACAVLPDGDDSVRLISQSTFLEALGRNPEKSRRARGTSAVRAPFLLANNLQPFISQELRDMEEPVAYRVQGESGRAWGYRAEMLPLVCEVYLEARRETRLLPSQEATAKAAEILLSGLARVGIVALVDEATGFQETRARDELQLILEKYVHAEFRKWVQTFPEEFFAQVYRLQGWEFRPGTSKRTPQVGKLVNKYIYDQLPPGVHEELRRVNPRTEKGYRKHKHHQHLTADTGSVHLDRQISTITTLMRMARDKRDFEELFERAFPPPQQKLPLIIEVPRKSAPSDAPPRS